MAVQGNKAIKLSDGQTISISGANVQASIQEKGIPAIIGDSTTPYVGIILEYDEKSDMYTLAIKGIYNAVINVPINTVLKPGDRLFFSAQNGFIPADTQYTSKNVFYVGENAIDGGATGVSVVSKILLA